MMTILHICDWYRPVGGAEKLMFDTLRLLEEHGHANVVVYNDLPGQMPGGRRPEYACKNLEFWEYFRPGAVSAAKAVRKDIDRIIDAHHPDLCHIHNFQNSYVTEHLIRRIPCVRSIHDPRLFCFTSWKLLPDKRICHYPLGQECMNQRCITRSMVPSNHPERNARWVIRNFEVSKKLHVLIAESRAQIEYLLDNGFMSERIAWIPNFTPIRPEAETLQFVREHFDPSRRMVLFVGRASFEKGINVLLDAVDHIQSDCRIVIITAGALLTDIQSRAARHGNRVEVIPGLSYEETRKYYARASVLVVPSVWPETFCLIGPEAYSNMKPVIGSRVGGILDWLKDGETGWFFEHGNSRDLAQKIDLALSDPKRLQEMGMAAYRRVCKYYSQDLYISRLLSAYQKGIETFRRERTA